MYIVNDDDDDADGEYVFQEIDLVSFDKNMLITISQFHILHREMESFLAFGKRSIWHLNPPRCMPNAKFTVNNKIIK